MRNEEWQRQTEQITITKQSGVGEQNSAPLLLSHFTNSPRKERQQFCSNRTCEQNVGDGALDVPFGECQGFALSQFCVDVPCCKCYAVKHFETIRRMLCG